MHHVESPFAEMANIKGVFPVRLKPEAGRRILHRILTKSDGEQDGWGRIVRFLESVEEAQTDSLHRPLSEEEKRQLRLVTLRDARAALLAVAADLRSAVKSTDTQLRRGKNAPYLLWRIAKEILMLHWGIDMEKLEARQKASGLRMAAFLDQHIEAERL